MRLYAMLLSLSRSFESQPTKPCLLRDSFLPSGKDARGLTLPFFDLKFGNRYCCSRSTHRSYSTGTDHRSRSSRCDHGNRRNRLSCRRHNHRARAPCVFVLFLFRQVFVQRLFLQGVAPLTNPLYGLKGK